jgi:carboxyl-terminal processing protease
MSRANLMMILLTAFAAFVGWSAAQRQPPADESAETYRLFVDAVEHVDRAYVEKVNRRELIENAINGMLSQLDPYSNFIPPVEKGAFEQATTGQYAGIGIQIDDPAPGEPYPRVAGVLAGSPAYEAGILAGDRILEAEGKSMKDFPPGDLPKTMLGEPGSTITVKVLHRPYDKTEPVTLKVERKMLNIESVSGYRRKSGGQWDWYADEKTGVGYIRIRSFVTETLHELEAALGELRKGSMKGVIIDLRFNPGGQLESAVGISDLFLKEGRIVSTRGRITEERVYNAKTLGTLPEFPLVILVNRWSASASEIVAACMQDNKRAIIVGERTWGKGSVQNVIDLEDGRSKLKLTTSLYARPNGHNIHRLKSAKETDEWGVKPDVGYELRLTDGELNGYVEWRRNADRVIGSPQAIAANAEAVTKAGGKPPAASAFEPFKDRQLDKAIDAVKQLVDGKKPAGSDAKPLDTGKPAAAADGAKKAASLAPRERLLRA